MRERELFLLFVRPLNRAEYRYAITGSIAAILYGEPRLTHDVDIIIFLNEQNVQELRKLFPDSQFYVPPVEVLYTELARQERGSFNIIHIETGFKADFYLTGRDELNAWAFRRKRNVQFEGETLTLAPPEYVIIRKPNSFAREDRTSTFAIYDPCWRFQASKSTDQN